MPLAATTYYYADKQAILLAASNHLLSQVQEAAVGQPALDARQLTTKIVIELASRHAALFCAWAELMLYSARGSGEFGMGTQWYRVLDKTITDHLAECSDRAHMATSAIDIAVGLLFVAVSQDLGKDVLERVLCEGDDPLSLWKPAAVTARSDVTTRRATKKSIDTRNRIMGAATQILFEDGPGAVTYRAVAERAELARGTPFYQYNTVSQLLSEAQCHLFNASKERYRKAAQQVSSQAATLNQLVERTSSIFWQEVTEQRGSSIASYSLWIEAARDETLRSMVWNAIEDQLIAWRRVLSNLETEVRPVDPLLAQALFVGKLIRVVATGSKASDRAIVDMQFRRDLALISEGSFWL